MSEKRRLKIHVHGKLQQRSHFFFSKKRAKKLGVTMYSLEYKTPHHAVIMLEGNKKLLWKFIHYSKTGPIFCSVDMLTFQFLD